MKNLRSAFTLIELLVVIAVIAILSVVVILSLNPAELLRQSRDSNRLSDLATLNSALSLYTTDQSGTSGFSLGNASSVYVSLPDSSSTCGSWSLPALPSGYTYACSSSTSSRNVNASGWIPVNFSLMSGGSPMGQLPQDSINQSSTGLYYTYSTNGSQFIVTAIPESQKQKTASGSKYSIPDYPEVMANGSNLTVSPMFNQSGLVGYWNFDEGAGSTTIDQSGNGDNGNWQGNALGTSGYYSPGKVGPWAGWFGGINTYADIGSPANLMTLVYPLTISAWVDPNTLAQNSVILNLPNSSTIPYAFGIYNTGNDIFLGTGVSNVGLASISSYLAAGQWQLWTIVLRSSSGISFYLNGAPQTLSNVSNYWSSNGADIRIGQRTNSDDFNGLLDDVRLYNRALSASEIQALYNAER